MFRRCLPAVFCAATLFPVALDAQTVQVEFVAPRDTMVALFGAANVSSGYTTGYRGIVIGPANVARFRAGAPRLLVQTYDSLQRGTRMRRMIDTLLAVVGHGRVDIRYLLTDDSTGLIAGTGIYLARRQAGLSHVWPFATVDTSATDSTRFEGIVRLGVHAIPLFLSDSGGWRAWEEVVIHESHHTQWVGFPTKWRSIRISYGADGGHFASELLGDQPVPLDEGIATFYGQVLNEPHGYRGMIRFARENTDSQYRLESWSVLAGFIPMAVPRVVIDTVAPHAPPTAGGRYALWGFRWRDVPGFYLLFNENTGTLFHQFFWRNACTTRDAALRMILREDAAMWDSQLKRYLYFAANELARQQEAMAAAPTGAEARACGVLTSSMFPYAILDILTHFGMSDQELRDEISRQAGVRASRASREYLNHRAALRAAIRARVDANPVQIEEAITEAVTFLRDPARILQP